MIFLVDAQLPPGLCEWLERRGHVGHHVSHLGMSEGSDRAIADLASGNGWAIMTKDEDFLQLHRADRYSLVWIRCGNLRNRALRAWLDQRWQMVEEQLKAGNCLIEITGVRPQTPDSRVAPP
ncbi:DUF5615 family PIN-like protein [Sandaracinobacteroides saxicola]|uniref:DUF5615 family PIN-like protein n=1 Tax=Sandaracinobacteroides saxicola TaxID=2759707 RepID=A0A7G5IEX7_9SPHN|nr:DUF5615 family PIN-like protein [Sandaracinobacteroides saxicola]QMW21919.1 DUF5615 family PIN-like protein [Sandaracinobacteroides saxicola]